MPGLRSTPPPDDSGSDAFERFLYQAQVAFPYCLACWNQDGVIAVYCEHFEDVLVEWDRQLLFIAIKTRDPAYGPWRLTDLCGPSGAFRSLLRTHRVLRELEDEREIVLEARLEGAVRKGDPSEELRSPRAGDASAELVTRCSELLGFDETETEGFLAQVRVVDREPPREVIQERNMGYMRAVAGGLSANALKGVYDAVMNLLQTAMKAQLLDDKWPRAVIVVSSREEAIAELADAKKLDKDLLDPAFAPLLETDKPLLIGEMDASLLRATALERKLATAGASNEILGRAKELRARAGRRLEEVRAARRGSVEDQLEDTNTRLLTVAEAVAASAEVDRAANAIWRGVLEQFLAAPAALDRHQLLAQDPMLLAGQICQLSDECRFEWGESPP